MASLTATRAVSDRQVDIETPEHVAIGYELADLGSRFTALFIDGLLIVLAVISLSLLHLWGAGTEALGGVIGSIGMSVTILLAFALAWGYFVLFEGLRDGQTPGKRWMGIRVVHDGGFPVTLRGAAVRNLLRIIDIQPAPAWLVGGVSMMLHPQTKRLGDLAAGTVVVRDRSGAELPEEVAVPAGSGTGAPRLSDGEFALLETYVDRRRALEGPIRAELSRTLMQRIGHHFADTPGWWERSPDESLVHAHAAEAARRRAAGAGGRAGSAQATALVRRQRPEWDEYRALLDDARGRGLDRLGEARVSRFATLYRGVAADLARARTYGGSPELLYTLERMVGFGHNLLYRPPGRSLQRLHRFAAGGFAALVRRRWKPILLATALFYLPGVLAFAAVRADPTLGRELVPPVLMARAEEAAAKESRGEGYVEVPEVLMPVFASQLISNNVQVTFLAFAGGILAGLGTGWILILNGLLIGGAAAVFANHGQSVHFWTFVLPHGVVELTAICIAGGAGLWLGSALVAPGRRTRLDALVSRGREAIALIGGTALMLIVAGVVEGFVSPSAHLPREAKLAFASVLGLLTAAYFLSAGRAASGTEAPDAMADR